MKLILFTLSILIVVIISCDSDSGSAESGGSGKAGSMARFAISGDYLYTVTPSELKAFDISDEEHPEHLNNISIYAYVETIFPFDSLLFLGTRTGMMIYDIRNPELPSFISEYWHIYSCDPVVVQDQYAYVTLNSGSSRCGRNNNRLDIIDISDLKNPQGIAEYDMVSPKGLGVDDNLLFLCDDGLKVFDITNKTAIELISHFNQAAGYDVIPDDGYLLMVGDYGLYQYSYTNDSIQLLSSILIN